MEWIQEQCRKKRAGGETIFVFQCLLQHIFERSRWSSQYMCLHLIFLQHNTSSEMCNNANLKKIQRSAMLAVKKYKDISISYMTPMNGENQ